MMKYNRYVDPFHGSGTIDLPEPEGIAAAWHFIKGLCGNTHPGAVLPFGKYSVCPYTSGYSSGYGINQVNSGEPIRKLMEKMRIIGFSHFHQSGTGAIGVYYNYAVVTPYSGEKLAGYTPAEEMAEPGYYSVLLAESGIRCECTVTGTGAYHRYTFPAGGGRIAVDFENDGLYTDSLRGKAVDPVVERISDRELRASVTLQNVRFHFVVVFHGAGALDTDGVYCMPEAGQVTVVLSAGSVSMDNTVRESTRNTGDFDSVRAAAAEAWEEALGKIDIGDGEDENELRIFYSNLYQSLIKPCDWGDGGFLWDGAPFVVDFATMWDIYKTTLPLLYTLYPTVSEHIVEMYRRLGETLGKLPHCFIMTTNTNIESKQARLNAEHSLYDAWVRGVPGDWKGIYRQMYADVFREDFRDFTDGGVCLKTTHTLDMAEGCRAVSEMAGALGYAEDKQKLTILSRYWKSAFDPATGLLQQDSDYYEGNHWNYSFRPMYEMEERIALAGGKDVFETLLDRFFGFTHPEDVSARFEGFNNETDMETPYAYCYIGRQDKLAEILRAADRYMFRNRQGTTGSGGIPGNNDSGGLSSCYVWNCLGLFPVSGQDRMFIGMPKFLSVTLHLANGRTLVIRRVGDGAYPVSASLNGTDCPGLMLAVSDMMEGGDLVIRTV